MTIRVSRKLEGGEFKIKVVINDKEEVITQKQADFLAFSLNSELQDLSMLQHGTRV